MKYITKRAEKIYVPKQKNLQNRHLTVLKISLNLQTLYPLAVHH